MALHKMTDVIAHRGPDGEGFHVAENVALGNRRLSIIDLSTGDQPMYNDDKSIVIVYNGEIYNYIELREESKTLGHKFKTESDTEVIIRAYEEWGTSCQGKFNGMWAFALWDSGKKILFCSRDRIGEKPFFYAIHDNAFVFGSEIKALTAFGVPWVLNQEMCDAYLCFTFVPAPYTFFSGISKLPPGHFMIVEDGRTKITRYWDVVFPPEQETRKDEENIFAEFEYLFRDSVRIRMRSDVPYGAFLSGGLDSSSIVATMSEFSSEPIKTFTIGFEEAEFDERKLARMVVEAFHTKHMERMVAPGDLEELLDKLAWHYDEPFGDSSALPTYVVSKIAREHVTVALTGDGGDEVLSGYTVHQGERFASQFSRIPGLIRKGVIPSGLHVLGKIASGRMKGKINRATRVVRSANVDFIDRVEFKQNGFSREDRHALIGGVKDVRPAKEFIEEAIAPYASADNFTKLNYWLLKVSLADDMLCKVDRASMANSLETRVPFLDYRIIELLATVSMDVKLRGYTRKKVLRETVGRKLPGPLLKARKHGFAVPLKAWLARTDETIFERVAKKCASSGFMSCDGIDRILKLHRTGQRDIMNALWTLAMLSCSIRESQTINRL